MMKTKKASVAGQFYTDNATALSEQLAQFDSKREKDREVSSRLVIAPHAGYIYSGQLMSESMGYLPKDAETVFIIAPAHHVGFSGLGLSSHDQWETPLGTVPLATEIVQELNDRFDCSFRDDAFAPEHAAEVEVPFLQYRFGNRVRIVPILVGQTTPEKVTAILEHYYDVPGTALVISSDLSHFLTSDQARHLDDRTARMIESGDLSGFCTNQACGAIGICGSVLFAERRGFSFLRAGMYNSGDVTGDRSRVVGYGSWFLYEGKKEQYLKQYYSVLLQEVARRSIRAGLAGQRLTRSKLGPLPSVLDQWGASFVTLELGGNLRGCIGSLLARTSILDDLISNAWNAAFGDPRFRPLASGEFPNLELSISLLGEPRQLTFQTEQEFLDQLVPFRDGLIILDHGRRATFLPSVWEELPEKKEFLAHLKIKAGLSPTHFSPTFEAWTYTTEYITEKKP